MLVSRCDGQSWRAGSRSRFSTAPHVHVIDAITVDVALQLAAAAMLEVEGVERGEHGDHRVLAGSEGPLARLNVSVDRKSTRLNSSHLVISYAVFCLKKKKKRL